MGDWILMKDLISNKWKLYLKKEARLILQSGIYFKKKSALLLLYAFSNVSATQQFRSFWLPLFPLLLIAKSWKLNNLLRLTSSVNFWT